MLRRTAPVLLACLLSAPGILSAQYFGRNKVQYEDFDFRVVDDKVIVKARVNGGRPQDFVLDTGSELTTISRQTASSAVVRPPRTASASCAAAIRTCTARSMRSWAVPWRSRCPGPACSTPCSRSRCSGGAVNLP